ncbi:MAG: DsrE family protein [Firmicutes bacterium]|nr:DsrE family protein [Bacillota bacterium]
MAKIAFWITAGPELEAKAVAGLRLAERLKTGRHADVEVFLYGPGLHLTTSPSPAIQEALGALKQAAVAMGACPVNVKTMGLEDDVVAAAGVQLRRRAVDALLELVEQGYQIIGI